MSAAAVVTDNRPALRVRRRDKWYATLGHLHLRHREHGRSCAVPPASERIVSINLAEAAEVTPRLVGYRYGE